MTDYFELAKDICVSPFAKNNIVYFICNECGRRYVGEVDGKVVAYPCPRCGSCDIITEKEITDSERQ